MRHILLATSILLLPAGASLGSDALAATSISQHGITWTFDRDYPAGQFATGDWWVVGPVRITNISPRDLVADDIHLHGTVFNPEVAVSQCQGFDSRLGLTIAQGGATNNVVPYCDHTHQNRNRAAAGAPFPITVPAGTSVLSSESYPGPLPEGCMSAPCHKSWLKTIAVLTVLASPPPSGAFRPPYVGTDKNIPARWNTSAVDFSKLNRIAPLPSTPSLAAFLDYGVEPQIEIITGWTGRYLHPHTNYTPARFPGGNNAGYGQSIANTYGAMLLAANMDYPDADRAPIVYRLIQIGLDIFGAAVNAGAGSPRDRGVIWPHGGGHNGGRKMPFLFAGVMLGDWRIIRMANHAEYKLFQEDAQFFFVSEADVSITHVACCGRAVEQYTAADIGMPEWGQNHLIEPEEDNRLWDAAYRNIAGSSTMPHVLAAKLMGVEELWNQPAIFRYYEQRFVPTSAVRAGQANEMEVYVRDLWTSYYWSAGVPEGIYRMVRPSAPGSLRILR